MNAEAVVVTKFVMDDGEQHVGLLPIQLSFKSEKDLFDWLNRLPYAAEISSVHGLVEDEKRLDVSDLRDEAMIREGRRKVIQEIVEEEARERQAHYDDLNPAMRQTV